MMMIYSIIIGITGSLTGIYISYYLDIPSGATIIFAFVVLFGLAKIIQVLRTRMLIRRQVNQLSNQ